MKKVLNRIGSIVVWLVVALAVGMAIFTALAVSTFDRSDREIFGYSAFIVMSDSMSRTDFDAGDVVLVKNVDPTTLKEGDIITFISADKDNYGETVTHKIRRLTTAADGTPGFITYGTTTGTDDSAVVTYDDILGKYQGHIPKIGTFFHFLKTTPGYLICILIPFLALIGFQTVKSVRLFRECRADRVSEIQIERARLEEERRRTEEMIKRLQKMREAPGAATDHNEVSECDGTPGQE